MAIIHGTQGTVLRRGTTTINQLRSIGPVGTGGALRDVTTLSDTVHKHKKNIPDLPEIAVTLYYDPQDQTHINIFQDSTLTTPVQYTLLLEQGNSPNEIVDLGLCWVLNVQLDNMEVDQDVVMSFSLKPQAFPIGLYDII
jgi:hypothetical protein